MEVYGLNKDLEAFSKLLSDRRERMKAASAEPDRDDPIKRLSEKMHPASFGLVLREVREETDSTSTFRFGPERGAELPFFRAGQYVSIKEEVGGVGITRPYSLSSAPLEALSRDGRAGFYDITIRRKEGGFFSEHVKRAWREGVTVAASGPHGNFYHDPLRDSRRVIAIAGGSGITPIRSMMRDLIARDLDMDLTILYGISSPRDIIFREELEEAVRRHADRIRVAFICSDPDETWRGPAGFITASCIADHGGQGGDGTFFVCGPPAMYAFLQKEFAALGIPRRRIRREVYGERDDVTGEKGFPVEMTDRTFSLVIRRGTRVSTIPARATETVLVALERAGIGPDSQCRSGECGWCRSLLLSGDLFVLPQDDGRRAADRKGGFFHPCSSYPLSDLEVQIPLTGAAGQAW